MAGNFIGGGAKTAFTKAYKSFINLPEPATPESQLLDAIHNARTEYRLAENRFNEATIPEMIDQAIYDMLAAQSKYTHLMRLAKDQNLHL